MKETSVLRGHCGIAATGGKFSVEVKQNGLIVDQVHGAWSCLATFSVQYQNYRTQKQGTIQGEAWCSEPADGYRRMRNRLLLWSALLIGVQGEGRGVGSREVLVTVKN